MDLCIFRTAFLVQNVTGHRKNKLSAYMCHSYGSHPELFFNALYHSVSRQCLLNINHLLVDFGSLITFLRKMQNVPYLMAYKAHFFFTKYIFYNSPASYILYVGLKFTIAEISYQGTPMSWDFRVTFVYQLSLFKRQSCRLKFLSLIIFIILISSCLILILCFFLICPAKIDMHLICHQIW